MPAGIPCRYYVLTKDCTEAIGFDDLVGAETAALAGGEGIYLIDTQGVPYRPSLLRVERGRLLYMGLGHINHRQGLDVNPIEGTRNGTLPVVKAFLTKGANPNATDAKGAPALLWAVASGNIDWCSCCCRLGQKSSGRICGWTHGLSTGRAPAESSHCCSPAPEALKERGYNTFDGGRFYPPGGTGSSPHQKGGGRGVIVFH